MRFKRLLVLFYVFFCFSFSAQKITFNPSGIHPINAEHHGFSYVNLYNTCTDPVCFDNLTNLKPRLIRFPSAGDADNYFMNFDSLGYGISFNKVAAYLADRYNALSNPLTTPPFTSYTVPAAFDLAQPVLNFNASVPAIFTNSNVASTYTSELTTWFNNYRKQQTQIASSYLTLFKQHIKRIEDSLQTGEKVNVIYVANIFSGTPNDLVKTLTQLTSSSITAVNVVGIELSNESWGKANDDLFLDPNSGNQFYYYVVDSSAYTGCIARKGNFIKAIRSNFPNIKIGFPTAPISFDYYGCNFGSGSDVRFSAWNSQNSARNTQSITVSLVSNSVTVTSPLFDAFVIHNYFDEKYWGNLAEGTGSSTCVDCLYNTNMPREYKNYLRAVAANTLSPNFIHPFAYYPMSEDDTLKESFKCQLKESFKFVDSGYVNKLVGTYSTNLAIANSNNKKIWMTEWNFHEGTDDTTNIFANTFNQAVLTVGWRMAMYRANWKFSGATDFFQYSALFNGVSVQQNGAISRRTGTTTVGDGTYDANSGTVRRMAYWASKLTRHISLDSLQWIDATAANFQNNENLRFYSFIDQQSKRLFLYYINAGDSAQTINIDSLKFNNFNIDTVGVYKESFWVKNNYSTCGYGQLYEQNKYYKTGPNWTKLFPNDPVNTYSTSIVSANKHILKRKSIGLLKFNIQSVIGLDEESKQSTSFSIYPNPSNISVLVKLNQEESGGTIYIRDLLGRTIKQLSINGRETKINISDMNEGVYLLQVNSKKTNGCKKFIVAK